MILQAAPVLEHAACTVQPLQHAQPSGLRLKLPCCKHVLHAITMHVSPLRDNLTLLTNLTLN